MEETVVHHLFDIIIDQLDPDLFQIVSACQKFLFICSVLIHFIDKQERRDLVSCQKSP